MVGDRFNVRRLEEGARQAGIPEHDTLEMNHHRGRILAEQQGHHRSVGDLSIGDLSNPGSLEFDSRSTAELFDPARKVSLVHLTMEVLPREDNYKIGHDAVKRPSLGVIHGEDQTGKSTGDHAPLEEEHHGHVKLGWIQGSLISVMLNIWGVMLFLRLSWVVGQSGIGQSLLIITISCIVCVITTLSLSAISTNGEVKGGGIYYIISRSLGPEFGAAIGIVFAFANAVAASMNTVGFCSSLNDLLKSEGYKIIDNGFNDIRIVGVPTLAILCVICVVGMDYEIKAQNVLLVVILGAILDFLVGAAIGPRNVVDQAKGFVGFSPELFRENLGPAYRFSEGMDQNIVTVFAIFFPSVTGVQAGANICGDLKDPAMAIPKGTLLGIAITMFSYALFVLFAGGAAARDASGIVDEIANGTYLNCTGRICEYGLLNSYSVMQLMSGWGPFIYAGCFAATLSTAMTNLLSVPKILQSLGEDHIYPGFKFFSKGYFKAQEPLRGYVLVFFISTAFLLIADLNAIAPLISNFYLASYGMINYCTFHAALVKPLGWRPTFKYYNKWVSLVGFFLCVIIMFIIDWITSLITYVIIAVLYLYVVYRKPDVNWGSSTQAQNYKTALQSTHRLNNIAEHVKNYRPQILVLGGKPQHRPPLMDLAYLITKHNSLLICGEISETPLLNHVREARIKNAYKFFNEQKIKSFYSLIDGMNFEQGAKALIQSSGMGKLKPNVVMMGYKVDWSTCHSHDLNGYFHVLHDAFDNRLSVVLLRLRDGLDYSRITDEDDENMNSNLGVNNFLSVIDVRSAGFLPADSNLNLNLTRSESDSALHAKGYSNFLPPESPAAPRQYEMNLKNAKASHKEDLKKKKKALAAAVAQKKTQAVPEGMTFFHRKHKKTTIDVWWLYDDGGLTILLPYIISTRHNWAGCKLRIFALANRKNELEQETLNMAKLLAKFRIEYACLTMVDGITDPPNEATQQYFSKLLDGFREKDSADIDCMVTDEELIDLKEKTDRQLRLRELLQTYSKDSGLVVMSLPMPRKGSISAPLYMAWLEVITSDMPPFVLVRGNHMSVLSFYA